MSGLLPQPPGHSSEPPGRALEPRHRCCPPPPWGLGIPAVGPTLSQRRGAQGGKRCRLIFKELKPDPEFPNAPFLLRRLSYFI